MRYFGTWRLTMKTVSALLLCLTLSAAGIALAGEKPSPASTNSQAGTAPAPAKKDCCVVCKKGVPCGDSCISAKKTCRQPPGCACKS